MRRSINKFHNCIVYIFLTITCLTPDHVFPQCLDGTLYGPLHSQQGVDQYFAALEEAKAQGGKIECGGKVSLGETMKWSSSELSLNYSGIFLFVRGQCLWEAVVFQVHGDDFIGSKFRIIFYKYFKTNACIYVHEDVKSWAGLPTKAMKIGPPGTMMNSHYLLFYLFSFMLYKSHKAKFSVLKWAVEVFLFWHLILTLYTLLYCL